MAPVLPVLLLALSVSPMARAQASNDADPWFGQDKALHFGASLGLSLTGYGVASLFTDSTATRLGVGAGVALGAGVAKELLDLAGFGHPSHRDLVWNVAGTAGGLLLAWVLDRTVFQPERDRERLQYQRRLRRSALIQGRRIEA